MSNTSVHQELRNRICDRIEADEGFEGFSIRRHLERRLRGYQSMGLQLSHKKVKEFIDGLCDDDTDRLLGTIDEIGPRIKAAQGFHFVHIFNTFLLLAGVDYVAYFIDQIESLLVLLFDFFVRQLFIAELENIFDDARITLELFTDRNNFAHDDRCARQDF